MNTYRKLVYYILDQIKLMSDDAYIEEAHITYLLGKVRAYLLKSRYEAVKNQISQANFQTITVPMRPHLEDIYSDCETGVMLRSTIKVPNLLLINNLEGQTTAMASYGYNGRFSFVNNIRFIHVGYNKWLKDFIYVTIGTDGYLYVKSKNPELYSLEQILVSSVFEDIELAAELDPENSSLILLDRSFPLEEGLVIPLMELVIQKVYAAAMTPEDSINNANDDLSNIANYLQNILKYRAKSKVDE